MNDFSYCAIRRIIIFSTVLLLSFSGKAEVVEYLGCEWVIPKGYNKISEGEYLGGKGYFRGKIIFDYDDSEFYEVLRSDSKVSYFEFESTLPRRFYLSSNFILYKKTMVGTSHISIRSDIFRINLSGLSLDDAIIMSRNCIDSEVMIEHYNKLDAWQREYCGEFGSGKAFCGDR